MDKTLTLPEEFVTRVDFRKFWKYILAQHPDGLTDEVLWGVKAALLDAGTPGLTAVAYFMPLTTGHTVDEVPPILMEVIGDLMLIGHLECASCPPPNN